MGALHLLVPPQRAVTTSHHPQRAQREQAEVELRGPAPHRKTRAVRSPRPAVRRGRAPRTMSSARCPKQAQRGRKPPILPTPGEDDAQLIPRANQSGAAKVYFCVGGVPLLAFLSTITTLCGKPSTNVFPGPPLLTD